MEYGEENSSPIEMRMREAGLRPARRQMEYGEAIPSPIEAKLRDAGLRPTRQRVDLAGLLFSNGNRHVTAEMLHAEAVGRNVSVSLATVYNTLNQVAGAGLLREVAIEGSKTYFDTTITDHQHFYFEHDGQLIDLGPDEEVEVALRKIPEGMKVSRIDVLIRLVPDE